MLHVQKKSYATLSTSTQVLATYTYQDEHIGTDNVNNIHIRCQIGDRNVVKRA